LDIQRINRTDPEKVYFHYRNMSGDTISGNAAVCLDLGTTIDGISSIAPAAASFLGWIGIADADVGDTGYGRTQCHGYRDSILLSNEGTSVTVTAGDAMHLVTGQFGLSTSTVQALSTCGMRYVVAATSQTCSAAAYTDGIIRCV
jgi:hypothetical protein